MEVLSFQQALADATDCSRQHLLLGNGFSIACRANIFTYGKLLEQADFASLSPAARQAFDTLQTQDFERVIRALRDSTLLMSLYSPGSDLHDRMTRDADGLRDLLVQTIAGSHPERPSDIHDDEYAQCQTFLQNFNTVYTFNYDLLLYWTRMHVPEGQRPQSDDGFRKIEDDPDAAYVVWEPGQSHEQNMWFLHGALHVFDSGTEIQKYTWKNTGIRLIEQIRGALERGFFPLFVAEGSSYEKLVRVRHSDYLAKAYRSFAEIGGALFVYGHSLSENDEHYLKLIERGKIARLYVGVHGDPTSEGNRRIIRRAERMKDARNQGGRKRKSDLVVQFYDSASAKVWRDA
jgi:hypothetical protein